MLATLVLLLLTVTFFEAVSRSGTPREARRPLGSLTARDHLVAARAGLVLLTRTHERGRAALAPDVSTGQGPTAGRRPGGSSSTEDPCPRGTRC